VDTKDTKEKHEFPFVSIVSFVPFDVAQGTPSLIEG
jgi:hypothetical protein